jgi:hypothetical protein
MSRGGVVPKLGQKWCCKQRKFFLLKFLILFTEEVYPLSASDEILRCGGSVPKEAACGAASKDSQSATFIKTSCSSDNCL